MWDFTVLPATGNYPQTTWTSGQGFTTVNNAGWYHVGANGSIPAFILATNVQYFVIEAVHGGGIIQWVSAYGTESRTNWWTGYYYQAGYSSIGFWGRNGAPFDLRVRGITFYGNGTPPVPPNVGGNLNKPLADEDIDQEFGIFDTATFPGDPNNPFKALYGPNENLVIAMSNDVGDNVYAVDDGTVIDIIPVTGNDCFELKTILGYCVLRFDPDSVAGTSYTASDYFFTVPQTNLYRVLVTTSLEGGSAILQYVVADAPNYVRIGLQITTGCIIGKTAQLRPSSPLIIDTAILSRGAFAVEIGASDDNKGVAFLALIDENLDLLSLFPDLSLPVDPGQACNRDPDAASCLFDDPNLQHREQWITYGGVQWLNNGGAILQSGAQIMYDGLPLVSSTSYSMTVVAQRLVNGSTSSLQLALGTTTSSVFDMAVIQDDYAIPSQTHDPDRGALYSARVINSGSAQIQIISVCVASGDASVTPNICYFANYSFDQDRTSWTYTGNVNPGLISGEIAMQDDATLMQTVRLYPNGASPHTYRVTLKAAIAGGQEANAATVAFTARYPSTGVSDNIQFRTAHNSATTVALSSFYQWQGREITFVADIVVSSETNAGFLIRLNLSDNSSVPVFIREICINDPFSHHPTGGGTRVWVPSNCGGRISPPADLADVGSWTFWLWQNTDAFYQCDLMPMLQRMFNIMYDTHALFRWSMLYWQSVVGIYSNWISDSFLPWLNGNFNNIAAGRVTSIGGATCDNIFCALDSLFGIVEQIVDIVSSVINTLLGIIQQTADLLLNTVTLLIDLIFTILNQIFTFISRALFIGRGLVDAWNNSNQPISMSNNTEALVLVDEGGGSPPLTTVEAEETANTFAGQFLEFIDSGYNCLSNPRYKPFCITLWLAENTVFNGARVVIIWAFGALALIFHAVTQYRKWAAIFKEVSARA